MEGDVYSVVLYIGYILYIGGKKKEIREEASCHMNKAL